MGKKDVNIESYFLPEKRYRLYQNSSESQGIISSFVFVFRELRLMNLVESGGFRELCSAGIFSYILLETQ
jgi:uncharacterized membrane-anchored protein